MYLTTKSHSPPPDSGRDENRDFIFQDMSDVEQHREQHGSTLNGGVSPYY